MKLQKNEGKTDREIRALLAIIIFAAGYFLLTGTLQIISFIIAAILLITAIIGFCGLYSVLGINTCKIPQKK